MDEIYKGKRERVIEWMASYKREEEGGEEERAKGGLLRRYTKGEREPIG